MAQARMAGWFDGAEDRDTYRIDLSAGQRVYVELQGGRLGELRPQMQFVGADGSAIAVTPARHAGPADVQAFAVVAPDSGRYTLVVTAPPVVVTLPVPYQLSVARVDGDAESDRRAEPVLLAADQPRTATFQLTGDRDVYAIDAAAGQRVLWEVGGFGLQVNTYTARAYGPGDGTAAVTAASSLSQVRFVQTAEAAGRYTLDLQLRDIIGSPAAGSPKGYTVTARVLPADDHADTLGAAETAAIGQALRGTLDLPGDRDAFAFSLGAGQRHAFDLVAPSISAGVAVLRLYDAAGTLVREGRPGGGNTSSLSFDSEFAGRYLLRVEAVPTVTAAALGSGEYQLLSTTLAADDLPGRLGGAPTLEPGGELTLRFDRADDWDLARFTAQQGERFLLRLTTASGAPLGASIAVGDAASGLPVLLTADADGTVLYTAPAGGSQFVAVSTLAQPGGATTGQSYRLQLESRAVDDHADLAALGTLLGVGTPMQGKLDLGGDADWFRVELLAGVRYRFSLDIPASDLALGVVPDLMLADLTGNALRDAALGAREQAVNRFVFTPERSGSYALRPTGAAAYTILVDRIADDDVPDRDRDGAPLLDGSQPYAALGMDVHGTDAAEWFVGGSRNDRFAGGGGADRFAGGAGDDRCEGGPGIDTAGYPGTAAGYALARSGNGWTLRDASGAQGTDTLFEVERLAFDGSPARIALDLDGNAGMTAKLIGVLFGRNWLAKPDIVGVGIGLLDAGVSPLELAQLALDSDPYFALVGSHTHRDFVNWVYSNLFGRLPGAADLQLYTGWLDRGLYSQASLALAAAELPQNAANIDLNGLSARGLEYLPYG